MDADRSGKVNIASRQLKAADIRYETLFQAASDPIVIGDDDGILICNPGFERLTGLSHEQIIGIPIDELPMCLTSPDDCISLQSHWNEPSHADCRFTWRFTNVSGEKVVLDLQIKFVKIENSMLRFCIGRDITREMTLLQEQKIALGQIDKNMAQLAALNDEIRNPLTIISMSAGMEGEIDIERILQGVEMIDALVDRLDQGFTESEKVRHFLQRTITGFMTDEPEG